MLKADKQTFIENLSGDLSQVQAVYLVDYAGLSVINQRELKKRLKEDSARFLVVKNTLLKLAGQKVKLPHESLTDTVLSGQTALVLADQDPIKPLVTVIQFAKEFELPQIKIGVVEGYFQDKDKLINLSNLGGKDAIAAQLIGTLMGPTYNLAHVMSAKTQELTYILDAISKQK